LPSLSADAEAPSPLSLKADAPLAHIDSGLL
nr:juvenile hormone esterase isoform A {N-terminal} [Trichoplusia ni, Peptide Partial, 30 aa] [Trichoplusia ni]